MYRFLVLTLAAALTLSAVQAGQMYRWVDDEGVTHFSSRPPPGSHSDQTTLKGGTLNQPVPGSKSGELANIKRIDLQNSGWQGCASSLCELVKQIDPQCQTSYCSRAKQYTNNCTSAACQSKKISFEKDMRDRAAAESERRQQQAINANATPTAPATQSQD